MKDSESPADGQCGSGAASSFRGACGIRIVAIFEAMKGGVVLLAGFGLLALVHRDVQEVAEELVRFSHLNPASHYPQVFVDTAGSVTDGRLWFLSACAFAYALLRFAEGVGLWRRRKWAEWFAVASGGVYLPVELFEIVRRVTWPRMGAFLVNVAIVVYLVVEMRRGKQSSSLH